MVRRRPESKKQWLSAGCVALRRWRVSRGMTQFQCSVLLRLRNDQIARIERGYHKIPLWLAVRIEDATGIDSRLWLQALSPAERESFLAESVRMETYARSREFRDDEDDGDDTRDAA